MIYKNKTIEDFKLSKNQVDKIDLYINEIIKYNQHTNIVGKSTIIDPWKSHILDGIQLCKFINNKHSTVLDMGSGAGILGIILAINNYTNIFLIDSNRKKINFINAVCKKLNIDVGILNQRIEKLADVKFDFLIARALANLNKLFFYAQYLVKKNSVIVLLKGKQVNNEIQHASKFWKFRYELKESLSDSRGSVVIIKQLRKLNV